MKKQQKGFVIYSNENSAKVKINHNKKYEFYYDCQGNKKHIVSVNNELGANIGQEVYIEVDTIKIIKLIYIFYIQPILFTIIGILVGNYISMILSQQSLVYKVIFGCISFTIALIYKDYYKEKNKSNKKYNYNIVKIIQ
ncbi:MAG: SoxR reducing system RseC family protein [Romboutsia sp.]